jgi:anti-sigma regulatory factor (Ser/Thr protein kinase)
MNIESIDALALVEEVVALMTPVAESKGLRLQHGFDNRAPTTIQADRGRLRQVLSNVIGNAVKFTHDGSIHFQLSQQNNYFQIEIIDTGIGIAEDMLDHIFKHFEQVDGSSQRQFGGTGLGLSISRRLCELMHGSPHASQNPTGGSIFTIQIPYVDDMSPIDKHNYDLSGVTVAWHAARTKEHEQLMHSIVQLGGNTLYVANPEEAQQSQADALLFLEAQVFAQEAWWHFEMERAYCGPRVHNRTAPPSNISLVYFPFRWQWLVHICLNSKTQTGKIRNEAFHHKTEKNQPNHSRSSPMLFG